MAYRREEAKQDLLVSLQEWGVRSNKSQAHSTFIQRCHEKVDDCFYASRSPKNKPDFTNIEPIPADVGAAVDYIFEREFSADLEVDMLFTVADNLEKLAPFVVKERVREMAPYRQRRANPRYPSRHSNSQRLVFELRPEFQRFCVARELDPQTRFDYKPYPSQKDFHEDQLCDCGSVCGIAFEGIVASHATNHVACQNCFARSLVWCGGMESSWQDLVCKRCHSTYEIKSKQSMEAIEKGKVFRFDSTWGGSFTGFHYMRKEMGGRHFMLFVSRVSTYEGKTGARVWPVISAEIERVIPNLTSNSFRGMRDKKAHFSIKSKVILKQGSRKRWFTVPYADIDIDKAATRAFKRVYSDDNDDKKASPKTEEKRATSPVAPGKTVEQLRKELDVWNLGGDDWEAYA